MEKLIKRLEAIARKNEDEFTYVIQPTVTRSGLVYVFEAVEALEGHTFIHGNGASLDAAIADAEEQIPGVLEEWDYKE